MPEIKHSILRFPVLLQRTLALFVCASLLPLSPSAAASSVNQLSSASGKLDVPDDLGRIEEFVPGDSGRTVYFIQDAHDSLEAQENIAALIHHLVQKDGADKVFEEGYEGRVPSDVYFGGISEPEIREKVSYYFMDKLLLGGAEYAHINRRENFELIGADSIRLHFDNVEAYQNVLRVQEETARDLEILAAELRRLSDEAFGNSLKMWMKLKARYDRGEIDFLDYLRRTRGLMIAPEKDDFPLLDLILKESRNHQESSLLENVDAKAVFVEQERLESALAAEQLTADEDLKLFHALRGVQLLQRLNKLSVSAAEYSAVQGVLRDCETRTLAKFLAQRTGRTLVLSKDWEENLKPAFRFYETAIARDAFIEKALLEHPSRKAVLVYGGFHLPGIREILKRRGDSFYVLSPRITSGSGKHAEYYRELMAGGFSRLAIPGVVSKAAVAPRAYEFTALDESQDAVFSELLQRAERAVKKLPAVERGRLSAEVDLILAREKTRDRRLLPLFRSELRMEDDGKEEKLVQLISRLGNQLDGNTLRPEWVAWKNYGTLLRQIYERLDFVLMSVHDRDYPSARRSVAGIQRDLPDDRFFDGARETLSEIYTQLAFSRSELRDSAAEDEDLSSAQIHAYRLARERKVVGLPYFARHHQLSFEEASKALIKAGFESHGPSEVGEQFVHPFTRDDEKRLLKENEPAGEDEDKTRPILRAGLALDAFKELLENKTPQDSGQPVILSAIPSELKTADDPARKVFAFRENMIHGLNNVSTYLLFSPRSVTYSMLLDAADDLWATLKILDDITNRSVNDYPEVSENLKDLIYNRNAATRTGASAIESAKAGQFTQRHYEEIRAFRKMLEKVYGRVVELVIQRESEYLLREETRREASRQWDGTEGFAFSGKDLAFAGQIGQEDLQRLKELLSANREDLKRLVKEHPEDLYFKAEDGLFEEEGRSVYLKLKVPVDVTFRGRKKQIERLRIKGLKPVTDERGTGVYLGRGSVENRIIPASDGSLHSVPDIRSPKGGLRASSARQEYEVMSRALDAKRFETDYPIAWGIFEGRPFLGEDTGFVIAGLDGEDTRLSTTPGDEPAEVLFTALPVQKKFGGEMDDDSARILFEAFGRSLRAYHDEGFYHGFPHLGNIGVRLAKGRFEIILRDLNTTKIRTADMTREEETAYRFIDTADVIVRLLNLNKENFTEPFLKGYFHGLDQTGESFRKMTAAAKDLYFLIQFLRLDDSLPPTVQMDDGRVIQLRDQYPLLDTLKINQEHPEFGALWGQLASAVQNRSELRSEDSLVSFLHDHVFIHRYGHYEILADYRYADIEAIDQETLRLAPQDSKTPQAGPFRVVLLNAYQSETAAGRKHPHLVILSDDSEKTKVLGLVTLQDPDVLLDGMESDLFTPGESRENSYFVTRSDVFGAYQGQALMQRAVTALLLKGAIRKWIPSPTQLYPSRRMYERMKTDSRLVLEGRHRVKLVKARSELREEIESGGKSVLADQPQDKELLRRLSTVKFPDFLISSTAYLLLSPEEKTVIKFFDPAPPFTMHSDPLWKFWVRGALKTVLGWHSRRLKQNYGEGYETMARYRLEHPGLPSHVRTRVLRSKDAFRLTGVPPLVRAALSPHRLWVIQDYVPQSWFVSQRILEAVKAGEPEKAREVLDVSLNYLKSFWKDGYTDADLGINMIENYLIAVPEGAEKFTASDVDFHDQGAFTDDAVKIKRFFASVRRSVDRIDAGMRAGKPLYSVLEDMGKEKPEYPFRNILLRLYSHLPEHPDDADALARHFLDRVRGEFTFDQYLKASVPETWKNSPAGTEAGRSELRGSGFSDERQESVIGTQEELVRNISENWEAIRERGFFMFDMQKTLAARKKTATEDVVRLLAWMLEEKVRLVINSGNPMKDVDDQILDPLKKFLAGEGKTSLLADGAFSVYSASGTVFVTFDEQGNSVEHPDYEAGLVIARPVLEKTIHDVLVEFGQKKFGLDTAGIEKLRAAYVKDASKNAGLVYELPWADRPGAYEPSRVHFDDLGHKAMTVRGPYIQLRGSRVTDAEVTSITITKLPSEIRPVMIARLKELLAERLGADFVNHLSLSSGGESSIDIFSADANKAKALIHYVETAAAKSSRPHMDTDYSYYFGDELTGNVHGSTMEGETHKGNDMIVAEYPFPDPRYGKMKLVALSPDTPAGFASQDKKRTYWAGREEAGAEELFTKVKAAVETSRKKGSGQDPESSSSRSELRSADELIPRWNQSSVEARKKSLEVFSIENNLDRADLSDWLMYVLLDPDFVNRRRVVELNNWNPKLMMDPDVLLDHLSHPWKSLDQYGTPVMTGDLKFNETQALRNKRMSLLILLVERGTAVFESNPLTDSEEERAYIRKVKDTLSSDIVPEARDWLENFDAKYEALKLMFARNQDYVLGEKRPMSFLDVFILEAARYSFKSSEEQRRDSYGWFHDDYLFSFVYALKVPELGTLLDRLLGRIEEEKRAASVNLKFSAQTGSPGRSELRSYSESPLDEAIFDLTRDLDGDLRREALGELRKLTMQKREGLDESTPEKKAQQAARLLSLLADPDSGVRNGTARVIARIDNFTFETILEFLLEPVIAPRYSDRYDYLVSAGIRNARLAALFALARTLKEDALLRRDLRWPVFSKTLNPDLWTDTSELPKSWSEARDLLESPKRQSLAALFAAAYQMDGSWKYAREAVDDLLAYLPESAAEAIVSSSEASARRSELRRQDVRSMIENTASMPANLFISYEDIRSPESPVYEDLFALAYLTKNDKHTRVVVYGVDAGDRMEERLKQLRDTAGVLMLQGGIDEAYRLYGRENLLRKKEGSSHSVHWSMDAARLKNQPGDLLLFLAESNQDLYAALLLARAGGELPGVSKGSEGFYSVTENFLREELQRFQASLVIERAA